MPIYDDEIVVLITAGTEITIPASAATLEKFVDDLAKHVESNFVSVAQLAAIAAGLKQ